MTNLDTFLDDHLAEKALRDMDALREQADRDNEKFDTDAWHDLHRQAGYENERVDRNRRNYPILQAIASLMGGRVVKVDRNGTFTVDGVSVSQILDLFDPRKITVGSYGDRQTYPKRKDGTFNYRLIAEKLVRYADKELVRQRISRAQAGNKADVAALAAELEMEKYQGILSASADPHKPAYVRIEIKQSMTCDEARKLIETLRGLGHKLTYS